MTTCGTCGWVLVVGSRFFEGLDVDPPFTFFSDAASEVCVEPFGQGRVLLLRCRIGLRVGVVCFRDPEARARVAGFCSTHRRGLFLVSSRITSISILVFGSFASEPAATTAAHHKEERKDTP